MDRQDLGLLIVVVVLITFLCFVITYDTLVYGSAATDECNNKGYLHVSERPDWLLDKHRPLVCKDKIDNESVVIGWKPR